MVTTGFLLGALSLGGWFIIYKKLPRTMRNFLVKRPLFTDAVAAILTYVLFQGTIIGLFAAAFCGLLTSAFLAIGKNPILMSWVNKLGEKWKQFLSWIENFGQEDRAMIITDYTPEQEAEKVMVN